jgi:hypothetical protein
VKGERAVIVVPYITKLAVLKRGMSDDPEREANCPSESSRKIESLASKYCFPTEFIVSPSGHSQSLTLTPS